ncbi:ATP-binding cassette domain-containing protein [Methylophaga sp.]|uniref:ATP-binding cassette domain-containing protein n=1 Tax=Methylophaga sp. TaxID=2024840 RepID=UPI0014011496|nr:ATP-binding cassette domain-containing protein [Methylophaga sp.]MTI64349.1 ATP-binding cassette domain-containing protein [Methylophaga sp.]
MIKFSQVSLRRGSKLLFESANLIIHPGQRIGLTGANGTGKSSLFALLRDELHADAGEVSIPDSWVTAHVAQETPAVDTSAIEYVLEGDTELTRLRQQLAAAEAAGDGHRQSELHDKILSIDGYAAESRAGKLMHGLGFKNGQENWPVTAFSGGWRMRLNLAQALMCRSDLLLLDEPTNHLDLEAVYWLEDWLRSYPGTLLVISHDRDFLDRVVTHVAHIEHQRIKLYTGTYSDFELARAEHLANQQSAYQKQQREIAHMRSFVTRFKAKATKARQAQSRIKALERMERIAPAHVDSPFHFSFLPPTRLATPLLSLDKAAVGYSDTPLISDIELSLAPGDRVGLLGPNGAGKSTLIKLIAGVLAPLAGKRREAKDIRIGYFAQHQLEQLRPEDSPLRHIQRLDPKATEQELRDFLGGFGFNGDKALEKVAPFSGGEKARLVLAILVYQKPALLLLDEPTNHLDLEMRLALTVALQEFEGALVVVSHDRHLLRTVADDLWLVAEGQARSFDGDLDDYRQWLLNQDRQEKKPAEQTVSNKKQDRQAAAARRQKLQPILNKVKTAEREMEKLTRALTDLETQLADTALYTDAAKDKLKTMLQQQAELKAALEQTESDWLEASEQLESAEADEE